MLSLKPTRSGEIIFVDGTSAGFKMKARMTKNQLTTILLLGAVTLLILGAGAALSPASLYVSLGLVVAINAGAYFSWYEQRAEAAPLPEHNRSRSLRIARGSPYRRTARRMPSRMGSARRTWPGPRSRLPRGHRRVVPLPPA